MPITKHPVIFQARWATQPCLDKIDRILDQEISFETDTYKSASFTTLHSIFFGIFLVFAQQYVVLLLSLPNGWLLKHLSAADFTFQIALPIGAIVSVLFALNNAVRLQFSEEDYRGRKARGKQADLRTDAASYITALSHPPAVFPIGQGDDLGQFWLTLRVLEDKLRIVKTYRMINPERVRAHQRLTGSLAFSASLAMICTATFSRLYHAIPAIVTF